MKSKIFLALAACSFFTGGTAVLAADELSSRVVIEAGFVQPGADLGAEFNPTLRDFGAETGYEAGFRLRVPVTEAMSVSPGFHFVDFGSYSFQDAAGVEFQTEALSYRFTLEWMYRSRTKSVLRPFIALAGGLYRNRVVGFYEDPTAEKRNDSVNTLGYSGRAGLLVGNFELSAVVHRNGFDTRRYFVPDAGQSYGWHQAAVRLGYLLPR